MSGSKIIIQEALCNFIGIFILPNCRPASLTLKGFGGGRMVC